MKRPKPLAIRMEKSNPQTACGKRKKRISKRSRRPCDFFSAAPMASKKVSGRTKERERKTNLELQTSDHGIISRFCWLRCWINKRTPVQSCHRLTGPPSPPRSMLGSACSKLLLHKCAFIYPLRSAPGGSTHATLNAGGGGGYKDPLGLLDVRLFIQHRYHCRRPGGTGRSAGQLRYVSKSYTSEYLTNLIAE